MNRLMDTKKAMEIGNHFWDVTTQAGLANMEAGGIKRLGIADNWAGYHG